MTQTDTKPQPTEPEYVIYRDPLAPEPANPYRWVDGYKIQKHVDSTHKAG